MEEIYNRRQEPGCGMRGGFRGKNIRQQQGTVYEYAVEGTVMVLCGAALHTWSHSRANFPRAQQVEDVSAMGLGQGFERAHAKRMPQ